MLFFSTYTFFSVHLAFPLVVHILFSYQLIVIIQLICRFIPNVPARSLLDEQMRMKDRKKWWKSLGISIYFPASLRTFKSGLFSFFFFRFPFFLHECPFPSLSIWTLQTKPVKHIAIHPELNSLFENIVLQLWTPPLQSWDHPQKGVKITYNPNPFAEEESYILLYSNPAISIPSSVISSSPTLARSVPHPVFSEKRTHSFFRALTHTRWHLTKTRLDKRGRL